MQPACLDMTSMQRMNLFNTALPIPVVPDSRFQAPNLRRDSYEGSLPYVVDCGSRTLRPPPLRNVPGIVYETGPFAPLDRSPPKPLVVVNDTPNGDVLPLPHSDHGVAHDIAMPLVPLDSDFQLYFVRMEKAALTTWHPRYTPQGTEGLLRRLFPSQAISEQARDDDMDRTTEWLLVAAVSGLHATRSVAYLFSDVLSQCPSREVAQSLKIIMERKVMALFSAHWFGVCGVPPTTIHNNGYQNQLPYTGGLSSGGLAQVSSSHAKHSQDKLNIAAFLGDLFAIGVVSPGTMCDIMTSWAKHLTTSTQYNGFYLLLLRASYPLVTPLRANCLLHLKNILIMKGFHHNLWWTIEICHLIDRLGTQNEEWNTYSQHHRPAWHDRHTWDRRLDPWDIFNLKRPTT